MGCIILSSLQRWFSICIAYVTYVTKICEIYIYKQIRFSVIVSVAYKSANANVQGYNVMFVLFAFK